MYNLTLNTLDPLNNFTENLTTKSKKLPNLMKMIKVESVLL